MRQDQPVASLAVVDQREVQQRRPGQVERALRLGGGVLLQPFRLLLLGKVPQVELLPGQRDFPGDELHRAAEPLVAEGGPKVRVPLQQGGDRRAHRRDVQIALQVEADPGRVDVERTLAVDAVEEQAFLQRRERQDVLESRLRHEEKYLPSASSTSISS